MNSHYSEAVVDNCDGHGLEEEDVEHDVGHEVEQVPPADIGQRLHHLGVVVEGHEHDQGVNDHAVVVVVVDVGVVRGVDVVSAVVVRKDL